MKKKVIDMKKILSGSALKMIAVVTMTIDHLALFLLRYHAEFTEPLFLYHNKAVNWYVVMRCIGRLAFPLFAFLLVEGFLHTSNRRRYGYSLLICALVSEIPWALLHHGFHLAGHNVLFTLLLGFLGLCAIERYQEDRWRQGVTLLLMFAFSLFFRADYGGGRLLLHHSAVHPAPSARDTGCHRLLHATPEVGCRSGLHPHQYV